MYYSSIHVLSLDKFLTGCLTKNPWMLQQLLTRHASCWVNNQEVLNDVLGLFGDTVPDGRREVELAFLDLFEENKVVIVKEGREAREPI